MSTNGGGN